MIPCGAARRGLNSGKTEVRRRAEEGAPLGPEERDGAMNLSGETGTWRGLIGVLLVALFSSELGRSDVEVLEQSEEARDVQLRGGRARFNGDEAQESRGPARRRSEADPSTGLQR